MSDVVDIPALFASVAERVDAALSTRSEDPFHVFYDYGRELEVTRNLIAKDNGITTKNKKYPLIWVVIPYDVVETIPGGGCEVTGLSIIIATRTIQASTSPDRIEKNFRPRLWPIYAELKRQIDICGYFEDVDEFNNSHTRRDQPYWDGKDGSSVANLFGDFIDAIQLKNIKLKVTESTCNKFRLVGA